MKRSNKNIKIAELLKKRRGELGLSQSEVAGLVGCMQQSQYCKWEKNGTLPRKEGYREKLISTLKITPEEIIALGLNDSDQKVGTVNIIPLIRTIAASGCSHMTESDFEFLIMTQAGLSGAISERLVFELMKYR